VAAAAVADTVNPVQSNFKLKAGEAKTSPAFSI
jgi:hypothetical protein